VKWDTKKTVLGVADGYTIRVREGAYPGMWSAEMLNPHTNRIVGNRWCDTEEEATRIATIALNDDKQRRDSLEALGLPIPAEAPHEYAKALEEQR